MTTDLQDPPVTVSAGDTGQRRCGEPAAARPRPDAGEYLSFRAGDEAYGLPILQVREIRSYEAPTRIAGAPQGMLGVMNLCGVVLPLIDLRELLGCRRAAADASTVVIVLAWRSQLAGVVVDGVSDVVALDAGQIQPAPDMASAHGDGSVAGIGSLMQGEVQRLLLLLDIDHLLDQVLT
jgi:purine-binding chemotaxis protein CheW